MDHEIATGEFEVRSAGGGITATVARTGARTPRVHDGIALVEQDDGTPDGCRS